MLEGLCGNKNIQKVLLFIFVNDHCYGTQLQRLLKTPLTSLQNALDRLEKGGVIISYWEGKTKIYQLNPAYPLLKELEQLLKKAYTLLPRPDKKLYSLIKQEPSERRRWGPELCALWERLKTVKHFTRLAQSRQENGWNGKGRGEVLATEPVENVLVFHERGSWQVQQGHVISFSNTFRWTLDRVGGMISLEHLRRGPNQPVFLFYLTPTRHHLLASIDSHLCEEDVYLATVPWDLHSIRLKWRVIGPKKNEEMECCYI